MRTKSKRIESKWKCGKRSAEGISNFWFFFSSNFHDSVRLNRTLAKSLFFIEINSSKEPLFRWNQFNLTVYSGKWLVRFESWKFEKKSKTVENFSNFWNLIEFRLKFESFTVILYYIKYQAMKFSLTFEFESWVRTIN